MEAGQVTPILMALFLSPVIYLIILIVLEFMAIEKEYKRLNNKGN